MKKEEMRQRLKEQLALEYNCAPGDFDRERTCPAITLPHPREGARKYIPGTHFFSMVTLGGNAVISADPSLHPFLKKWAEGRPGFWLFEHDHLLELEEELKKHGKTLGQSHHMFLPDPTPLPDFPPLSVKWFQEGEMDGFYGDPRFPNAVCQPKEENRPDTLAVAAMDGEKIMGLAGCSADAPDWWQIGIDVLPEYRSRGVGSRLVALLKEEILRRGKLPFYGTSLSNLHSWNIALGCGFFPAWVEIETQGDGTGAG